jgi:transcriptional regulator with XRE-family HTH domain
MKLRELFIYDIKLTYLDFNILKMASDINIKLKNAVKEQKTSYNEIANKTGLSRYTVINVINGTSNKRAYIDKIAAILNVSIDESDYKSVGIKLPHSINNFDNFSYLLSLISKNLDEKGVVISKYTFDRLTDVIYNYYSKNLPSNQLLASYIEGAIDFAIQMNYIHKK